MKSTNKILVILLIAAAIAGCKKSFLDRPSNSQISSNNFYKSTSDLRLATASLYGGAPWWGWQNNALIPLGDVLSGNATYQWNNDLVQLYTRTITAQNGYLSGGWTGLYNVIGQANSVINAIQKQADSSIPIADKNAAIAEAKFIRAVAYYHLAVYWGAVPIIEDNSKLIKDPLLTRNIVSDVYKFIAKDLTFASQNLPKSDAPGRLTTWSAQGMLGKVYLTMAGWGKNGTRDQALLDSAKKYAGNVCKSSGLSLFSSYYNLFRTQYNDSPESLFALQWAAGVDYGNGNAWVTYSPSNDINPQKTGAWTALAPSYDLYLTYTAKDTLRRKATIMLTGDYYPELNAAGGGYTATQVCMKKHIIGNEKDNNAPTMTIWSSPEHNAILRLADVYLVYAEAILGNNGTTSDGDALTYFNKVRERAGIDPASTLTADMLLKERRAEFAFEGQYWIDLVRLSYYNPQKALDIINHQKRIAFSYDHATQIAQPDTTAPSPALPATIRSFTLQIPASEVSTDPKLSDPPVPYY
ncbi:RagB/SusD family nutrient uptake outer membrane protein [Mucilaginibacter sabulilitoris]|uniref:RagB/SusD family nutrient uptake outer membrane protein n=1 Tax=Mucilaginibacter sabulilitoris TaxID=1173583 RepID=A0ABZ0TSW9_9SPHI|nr:RagB/SusD family nutrient uptake outer membrane protein [Mucilaginibacter sabulilitoris]WPU94864.1 RagB/SusD family nutrient uptake outer membrane protein [Mucilaginibacter sabulilitoris]